MTYSTKASKIHRDYCGDSRHKSDYVLDEDVLEADTIEELYEAAAEYNEQFLAKKEIECRGDRYDKLEDYRVDFSEIYSVVEKFDDKKLRATKAFSERTAIREAVIAADNAEKARKKKIQDEWEAKKKEERDLEEFKRLSKKFRANGA